MGLQEQKMQRVMPPEGFCRQRTRGRLLCLVWAALFFFVALACVTAFVWQLFADKTYWELEDKVTFIFCGVIAAGAALLCIYQAYVGIRDAFFPEKSTLAQSIRSQLPVPDAAPPVKQLFAMVDHDIRDNGIWFDNIAVGKEWVFGDEASYIPRIRAVFGRDEIQRRHSGRGTHTTRIIKLYILDDRHQPQISSLKTPAELQALLSCLKLRAPDALFLPYAKYTDYLTKTDLEWETLNREYRQRQAERESKAELKKQTEVQSMILTMPDGSSTSRVTPELVSETMAKAAHMAEGFFALTPGIPMEANGQHYAFLQCLVYGFEDEDIEGEDWFEEDIQSEAEVYLVLALAPEKSGPAETAYMIQCDYEQAQEAMLAWLDGKVPNPTGWQITDMRPVSDTPRRAVPPARLVLFANKGAGQSHTTFTREDVQVAADGIVDCEYSQVDLTLTGGYLWIQVKTGDASDGRCTVTATRVDPDGLKFFTTKSTHRQAAEWLMGYYDRKFRPEGKDWKDCTKKMLKK